MIFKKMPDIFGGGEENLDKEEEKIIEGFGIEGIEEEGGGEKDDMANLDKVEE